MKQIKQAAKLTLKDPRGIVAFILGFISALGIYYWALVQTVSFDFFIEHNPIPIVTAQIGLSVLNALLIGLSFTFFYFVIKNRVNEGGLNILQTVAAMFFSVASTGCYVCGSVLLPAIGVAASLTSLPFGGVEIKILTAGLLVYSLKNLAKQITGFCSIVQPKEYIISFGGPQISFNFAFWQNVKPLLITSTFAVMIFALPAIVPSNLQFFQIASDQAFCEAPH